MVQEIALSPDQVKASEAIIAHIGGQTGQVLTMGGYAGAGKTTTLAEAIRMAGNRPNIAFCAFSGKAASVLKAKLERATALAPGDYVGTIHGLIYKPRHGNGGGGVLTDTDIETDKAPVDRKPITGVQDQKMAFDLVDDIDQKIIVVDEASMVNAEIFEDLKSFGRPIIAIGDHGQLPPVFGSFNLMENPMIRLEKIHRQAEGDPIIEVSRLAREDGRIPIGVYGPGVEKIQKTGSLAFASRISRETMVLCGMNTTRVWWNNFLRTRHGFASNDPEIGERIICLKNNKDSEIYNGMTGTISGIVAKGQHWYKMQALFDQGNIYDGWCYKHQFGSVKTAFNVPGMPAWQVGDLFDWAWAMTVHKSQGSEANDVVVLEERMGMQSDDDWRRWLYTATTRSKKKLLVVGS